MKALVGKLFHAVLSHRKLSLGLATVLLVVCACCIPFVKIDYQFSDYLPESSPSTQSLRVMEEAFDAKSAPNARLMASNVSLAQARTFADGLQKIQGIEDVIWLGSVVDTSVPLVVADSNAVEQYFRDSSYLYQITIDTAYGVHVVEAVGQLATEVGVPDYALVGEAVNSAFAQSASGWEIQLIMIMAVIVILSLLLLSSSAWFEPVLFLSVIGISIVYNLGTNIIFGQISFITQMCAAILQLAVSMDYGIVMLHTYQGFKAAGLPSFEAAYKSMFKAASVIASSAATTFFGFLALCVMAFLIGMDMGLVLAKGIIFSFLSVLFILPVLILVFEKPLQVTAHKPLLPSFKKFSTACMRLSIPFAVIIALIVVPVFLGQQRPHYVYGAQGFVVPGTQIYEDTNAVNDVFGASEQWVLMVPQGKWGTERALANELEAHPQIKAVTSYATAVSEQIPLAFVGEDAVNALISNGWSRMIVSTKVQGETDDAFGLVQQVRDIANKYYPGQALLVGSAVTSYDMSTIASSDSMRVLLASVCAILLVLLIMFRSLTIPVILVLTIEISIWINLAIPYFAGTDVQYIGYLIISSIMLGATVDYTIILSKAYLENRKRMAKRAAMTNAIAESAVTILTSATILTVCGALIGVISTNGVISGLGTLIGRGAFIAALNTFLLLPALYMLLDKVIQKTTYHAQFYHGKLNNESTVSSRGIS